jgi:hypothetical protein
MNDGGRSSLSGPGIVEKAIQETERLSKIRVRVRVRVGDKIRGPAKE